MKGIVPIVGWVILGLALLVSFGIDCHNTWQGGSIDLRNRITGVRLLTHDIDPYHYAWREPEPPEYCDPYDNPNLGVSKTTVSPALLILHLPYAEMPYRLAQWSWLLTQWLLLLGTTGLWIYRCTAPWQRQLLAAFVTGLTYTAMWRLHAERGQAYVIILFIFACWLIVTLDPKRGNGFAAGFLAGFLAALRPPLLALAPFLLLHRRGQLIGAVTGLILSVCLPMLWEDNCWSDYHSAMQTYTDVYRNDFNPHYQLAYPAEVEGIPIDTLANFVVIPYADFSVHNLLKALGIEPFPVLPVLLVGTVPYLIWLWWSRAQKIETLLAGVVAWMFLIDLVLPSYRNNYNDVLIINLVALGLMTAERIPRGFWPCLVALPLGWIIYATVPQQDWLIDVPSFLFTLGAIAFLFSPGSSAPRRAR